MNDKLRGFFDKVEIGPKPKRRQIGCRVTERTFDRLEREAKDLEMDIGTLGAQVLDAYATFLDAKKSKR